MRKSTLLWLFFATLCGITLFHTSQKVHDERVKLAALDVSISKEEESIRVLHTEWGYLNQPVRLEKLAKAYLKLAPMKGSQFARVEDLPPRPATVQVPEAAAETQETAKPDIAAVTVAPPPIIKILKPEAPAVIRPTPPITAATNSRRLGDVIKSLGVE